MIIRPYESRDADAVVEMLQALYTELGEEEESVEWLSASQVQGAVDAGTWIALAEAGGVLVGLVTVTMTRAIYAGGAYAVIDEMYVVSEHRSAGAGKRLIEAAVAFARQSGCKRIDVTGPTEVEKWQRTMAFYEQNGFTFTGNKLKISL